MADGEQFKPLPPPAFHTYNGAEESPPSIKLKLKKKRYIQFCGCVAALLLIKAVVILILFFTFFRIHDPKVWMNSVTIQRLEFFLNGSLRTDVNVTLLVDVSVKNPNVATFRFDNSTTFIYYGGRVVGDGVFLEGKAKAKRTLRRNMTIDLIPAKLLDVSSFKTDIVAGAFNISSYSRIRGRVKILKIVKKKVLLKLNCSMTYSLSDLDFHGGICKPELDL